MKPFFVRWTEFANSVAEYVLVSGFFALACVFLNKQWRMQPLIPLAGLLLGPVAGHLGALLWGETGAIILTFAGTVVGPAIVMQLQDEEFARKVIETGLEKFFPKKGRK